MKCCCCEKPSYHEICASCLTKAKKFDAMHHALVLAVTWMKAERFTEMARHIEDVLKEVNGECNV